MELLRKMDPDWVLILVLLGLVISITAYEHLANDRIQDRPRGDQQNVSLHKIVDSQNQCLPAPNGHAMRKEKTES